MTTQPPAPTAAPSPAPADAWVAPTARGPLDAPVEVPGSKSLTHRLLVRAALADGRRD